MTNSPTSFLWYELMTTDPKAAADFYKAVVGWTAAPSQGKGGIPYTVLSIGERGIGGIMEMPESYRKSGGHPAWVGHIHARNLDAALKALEESGGKVHRGPNDIPDVGRFAVVADPQGAMFLLLQPNGPDQPPVDPATPGHVGWHELYTSDWKAALAFYSDQFGWAKDGEFDMGDMGVYALFSVSGRQTGGMMNKPAQVPSPVWQFYFNVDDLDAAAGRVTAKGGKVLMGPMEVPGGSRVVQCQDPQGAHFALLEPAA